MATINGRKARRVSDGRIGVISLWREDSDWCRVNFGDESEMVHFTQFNGDEPRFIGDWSDGFRAQKEG